MRERKGNHIADAVRSTGCNNVIIGFILLQHLPLHLDIIASESPVTFGINVTDVEAFIEAMLDSSSHHGHLSCDEFKATSWTFVVEKDSSACEHVVRFSVVSSDFERHDFRTPIW